MNWKVTMPNTTFVIVDEKFNHFIAEASDKDSADFIVRAANSHDELLEALENIEANLTGKDYLQERIASSLRYAREAIAKAKGD